jgi:MoaA/NifB/PqqE/SkfB family radical SAM enzyme
MVVRLGEDGSFFYVHEPEAGRHAPERARVVTSDGRVLTRRPHGYDVRIELIDETTRDLPVASWLRAAAAFGRGLPPGGLLRVRLRDSESVPPTRESDAVDSVVFDARVVTESPIHHPVDERARELLSGFVPSSPAAALPSVRPPARRVLFFESLMNSDLPHNDCEISQGVLHMASTLREIGSEPVLANVKMSIVGTERPVLGLENLEAALGSGPVDLVCITLLEGYFDGVVGLIATLRRLGCRAHVAVGGVMPTLTPEHVAAHLPDVTFVCRGAGEYFVPRLAQIVGTSTIDEAFSPEQRRELLEQEGLIAIDRKGRTLIAASPARTVKVESLDGVAVDLGLIQPRHLEQGVEISTSRGCIHKCSFCSIIGRQSYQARSAEGVFQLLERYSARYRDLFADEVPRNAFRVHVSDDDFACDKQRAKTFFEGLLQTPFRLASVQVSIADLCARDGNWLLPKPDSDLLSAIRPECFDDSRAEVPERDFVLDHKSRTWSAYLQIGVETFSDKELDRLGKGYGVQHLRCIVEELARRRIHMDAYLILANSETSAGDLVDSVTELCRLKLRHPTWFHVRFPVVPRLVSYFPSASHRRMLRKGQSERLRLRGHARVPNHPEFDYPFVDADEPADEWVRAVDGASFSDLKFYTQTLENVRQSFAAHGDAALSPEREHLLRRLDDQPRRLVFDMLQERLNAPGQDGGASALSVAEEVLGPRPEWMPAFRRWVSEAAARMVVIPTWQCELRCVYCWIPKQDGRVMPIRTLERSIDLLLSTDRDEALLQFFGGEALIEYESVKHAIDYGMRRAEQLNKRISFVLSSNGWSLDDEKLAWLGSRPVKLELSLDGTPDVQRLARPSHLPLLDSYQNGIAPRAAAIRASKLAHEVIMVVLPHNVARMPENFFHIASLGFERIQINFALGVTWRPEHKQAFADGLHEIGRELKKRWARGEKLAMVNLENAPLPVRLNGEITVDYDGTIYSGNGFLHETEHKQKLVAGHLDDLRSFDRYWLDAPDNDQLLKWGYPADVTANNRSIGAIMSSFVRWMQSASTRAEPSSASPSGGF